MSEEQNTSQRPGEDASQAIQTFAIYHYQSILDAGYSMDEAKADTAALLEEQYYKFANRGQMTPKALGTVERRIERLLESAEALAKDAPAARPLYNDLLSLQAYVRRKP